MLHSRVPVFPPIDHTTNVHETIEFHWKHNAELPVFAFNEDGSSDVTEISFLEFGRAVHRAAHVLRPNRQGNDGEVVAFIALSDVVVYQAVFIGLMKAGLVVRDCLMTFFRYIIFYLPAFPHLSALHACSYCSHDEENQLSSTCDNTSYTSRTSQWSQSRICRKCDRFPWNWWSSDALWALPISR